MGLTTEPTQEERKKLRDINEAIRKQREETENHPERGEMGKGTERQGDLGIVIKRRVGEDPSAH